MQQSNANTAKPAGGSRPEAVSPAPHDDDGQENGGNPVFQIPDAQNKSSQQHPGRERGFCNSCVPCRAAEVGHAHQREQGVDRRIKQ